MCNCGLQAWARVNSDEYDKENPQDFALWKKEKNVTPLWIERSEISKYWNKITRPASRHALGDYLNREEKKKGDDISIYKINRW